MRIVRTEFAILAAALLIPLAGCSKSPDPKAAACSRYQQLVSTCRPEILALARDRIKAGRSGSAIDDSESQYKMFESRFLGKTGMDQARKQCEKLRDSNIDSQKKKYVQVTACCSKDDCRSFAECIFSF